MTILSLLCKSSTMVEFLSSAWGKVKYLNVLYYLIRILLQIIIMIKFSNHKFWFYISVTNSDFQKNDLSSMLWLCGDYCSWSVNVWWWKFKWEALQNHGQCYFSFHQCKVLAYAYPWSPAKREERHFDAWMHLKALPKIALAWIHLHHTP